MQDPEVAEGVELLTQAEAAEKRLDEHNDEAPPAPVNEGSAAALMRLIERVTLDPNFDVAKLNQLLDVKERWDREEARKAYHAAMALFQSNLPRIEKNKHVKFASRDQNQPETDYWHADLAEYVYKVAPALGSHGAFLRPRCRADRRWHDRRHLHSHARERALEVGHDEGAAGRHRRQEHHPADQVHHDLSQAQHVGGGHRLAAEGEDDDGRGASDATATELISAEQLAQLNAEIENLNADRAGFLEYLGVGQLEDLPAAFHAKAVTALEAKRKAKARGQAEGGAEEPAAEPEANSRDPDPVTRGEQQ